MNVDTNDRFYILTKSLFDRLTDDERLSIMYDYCLQCGCKDPLCKCSNYE